MKWFLKVMNQYADFDGRARRKEYWMFTLFTYIITIILGTISGFLITTFNSTGFIAIYFIFILAIFIPSLAVLIRRLHDTGKSGWMILVSLIPLIGAIWLLILLVSEGDAGTNEYGPNPKSETKEFDDTLDGHLVS